MIDKRETTRSIHVTLVPRGGPQSSIEFDVMENASIPLQLGGLVYLRGLGGVATTAEDETRLRVRTKIQNNQRTHKILGATEIKSRVHAGNKTTIRSDQFFPDTVVIARPIDKNDRFIYDGRSFPKMIIETRGEATR